jgi:hypothetical protein
VLLPDNSNVVGLPAIAVPRLDLSNVSQLLHPLSFLPYHPTSFVRSQPKVVLCIPSSYRRNCKSQNHRPQSSIPRLRDVPTVPQCWKEGSGRRDCVVMPVFCGYSRASLCDKSVRVHLLALIVRHCQCRCEIRRTQEHSSSMSRHCPVRVSRCDAERR